MNFIYYAEGIFGAFFIIIHILIKVLKSGN